LSAPAPDRPHLWVPYPYMGDAEICTLCGEFQTPANAVGECAESFDEPTKVPADAPQLEPADGVDDEMRQGAIIPP
jgi:hypothetical protein